MYKRQPKGYVDITTLKTNTFYKVPKGVLTGIFDRVCLKAPNDDGTWFKVDDSSNSTGWRGFGGDTISLMTKSDTNITLYTLGVNGFAKCLNIQKENGKWSLKQTMPTILCTSNRAEYTPTTDYHPATKKYVDDKVAGIVNSAPETLDTLQELATALGNDANFATTISTQIGKKVDKVDGMSLTHNDLTNELKANYDAAYNYSQAKHSYNDLTDKPTIPSIDGLATTEYVDSKSLPILFLDDSNRTGDKLFPLLPEHNLVFIAGDAQFTDENGNINIIYGLCYSDLQSDAVSYTHLTLPTNSLV